MGLVWLVLCRVSFFNERVNLDLCLVGGAMAAGRLEVGRVRGGEMNGWFRASVRLILSFGSLRRSRETKSMP
jgi:hypothetical protein